MTDKILLEKNVNIKDNDFVLVKGKEYSFICSEEGLTIEDIMELMKKCQRLNNRREKRPPTQEEYSNPGKSLYDAKLFAGYGKCVEYFPMLKTYYKSSKRDKKVNGIVKKLNKIIKFDFYHINREMIDLAYIETRKLRKLINRENFLKNF